MSLTGVRDVVLLGSQCLPTSLIVGVVTACAIVVVCVISFVVVCLSKQHLQ